CELPRLNVEGNRRDDLSAHGLQEDRTIGLDGRVCDDHPSVPGESVGLRRREDVLIGGHSGRPLRSCFTLGPLRTRQSLRAGHALITFIALRTYRAGGARLTLIALGPIRALHSLRP